MRSIYPLVLVLLSITAFGQITSQQDGDWDNPNSWDCACVPDVNSFDDIIVSHDIIVTNDINLNRVTITNGASVTINAGVTVFVEEDFVNPPFTISSGGLLVNNGTLDLFSFLFFTPVDIHGTLESSSTIDLLDPSMLAFHAGSIYRHNHASGGDIPLASWDPNSTVEISGLTNASPAVPNNLGQTFGNFRWNTPSMGTTSTFSLGGQLVDVLGDLEFVTTGTVPRIVRLANAGTGYALSVGGDFIINGGSVFFSQALSTASTITARNFEMNGGNVNFAVSNTNDVDLVLTGDFLKTGGNLVSGSGTGTKNIRFAGNGTEQDYQANVLTAAFNFIVDPGAVLNLDAFPLITSGSSGTFTLEGTVRLGSLNGTGAIQGNIPMSSRTFNTGSLIVLDGTGAQFIGSSYPASTGVDCQIANSAGVTLVADVTVGGNLTLTSGDLAVSNRTLTLDGSFAPNSNSLVVSSASSLNIGGVGNFGTLALTGSTSINNFTISRLSGGSVTLGSDLTIIGTLTQDNGDIVLNGNTFTISGPYARNNGTFFIDAASDFLINGSGALPAEIAFGGDQILNSLTINRSSSTFGTNSSFTVTNLNLLSGTFSNTGTITIATNGVITRTEGSIINNTPTAQTVYDIVYNIANDIATASEIPANDDDLRHVTKTGGAILTLSEPITINGNLTISNGVFNAATHGVDLKGNFIANSTSQLTASTFTFSGNTTVSGGAATVFGAVTITGIVMPNKNIQINGNLVNNGTLSAGTGTTTFGGTTTISGSGTTSFNGVTINASSTLTAPSGSINVGGNFTNNGTFTHSNGTIVFNGTTAIAGSSASSFNNVSITGTLTAPSSSVLSIAGNLSNSGTFNNNNGTLLLNGTVLAQAITGTYTMNNINISNPSGVNNNGNVSLVGTLSLVSAGRIDADGSGSGILTVRSTSTTEGGRIAAIATPANFTGQVTIERFVNSPAGWRYLSMPITNGNVGMWQDDFPVTGNFSNPSPAGVNNVTQSSAPSIYFWNSTTQAYVTVGSGAATGSTSLSNTVGYSPYSYMSGNFTVTVRGNPRIGATSSTIASSGFALVPNPYPSSIDWDNMDRTGLSSTVSIRVANGVFASYVAGGLATNAPFVGWTGEIAMGQSFWVESTGATSVNFAETDKTSNQYQFLREGAPENYLRIVLQSKTQQDEALIWFVDEATNGFDDLYDAKKMKNGYFEAGENPTKFLNLFTKAEDGVEYAINSASPLSCNTTYHLQVTDVTPGDHTLLFKDMQTLKLGYQVVLVDQFLQTEKIVTDNFEYNFSITEDEASANPGRFKLRFLLPGSAYINSQVPPAITVSPVCDPAALTIQVATQPDVSYQFFNGETAITETFFGSEGDLTEIEISKEHLQPGANLFSLRASNEKACENHVYANVIDFNFVPVEPVSITQEGALLTSNIGEGNQWYKDGVILSGADGTSLEVLESGEYHVGVSFGGCMSFSQHVKVDVDALLRESYIKAYPNPVTERLTVVLPEEMDKQLNAIVVFDARGMRVTDSNIDPRLLTDVKKTIDLTHVKGGLYILQIQSADKTYRLKVIKK